MVIVSKQLTVPSTRKQLSDYAEGDIVKIPENNTPVEFYVAKHNYESGLNGNGRTLVVRKDCYDERVWSRQGNSYASSDIDTWLNSTYKNLLDDNIKNLIETTKFYYTIGNNNWNIAILERSIFLLSVTEFGESDDYANIEGEPLPTANILKIANLNGRPVSQLTRSPYTYGTYMVWRVEDDGHIVSGANSTIYSSRPVFTLPSSTKFDPDTNVIIV